jgi:primosomal protein N' (replication factor Y)
VIIQTSDHDHPVIRQVVQHDYRAMYNEQLEERRKFRYPPFCRLVKITLRHRNKDLLDQAAADLAIRLRLSIREKIMGPEYPLVSRIRNLYLKDMLVKIEKGRDLPGTKLQILIAIRELLSHPDFRSLQYTLDVDPV